MLDFSSEDIDGMDNDAGELQGPPRTGQWAATSSYNIYMVDTPTETSGGQAMEDNPSGRKAKHVRYRHHSKPHYTKNGLGNESTPDGAKNDYNPSQPTLKQAGPMMTGCWERDNHTPPLTTRQASAMMNSAYRKTQWNKFASSDGSWIPQGACKGSKSSLGLTKMC